MRRSLAPALGVVVGLALCATLVHAAPARPATLVALRSTSGASERALLRAAGATLVDRSLRLWRVPASSGAVVGILRARSVVGFAERERTYTVATTEQSAADPLSLEEWWRAAVDATGVTPPGPGVPVTIVDSGLDLQHPEFAGRPDTVALNEQEPQPLGGEHGTMVASLIGAPENGVGVVGIYPQAVIRSWDAAKGQGTQLEAGEIVSGILAAARAGRGVINLSLGGPSDLAIEYAVDEAVARGSLVVAASGNEGGSNTLSYPAALPHVLTVGATDREGRVASFSSTSPFVDVAAPGQDVTVATALGNGWVSSSGTSFSAPLVSGAAAWIWTVRPELTADQVAELIRRTAHDLEPAGRDAASGYGLLDVAAALVAPAPHADTTEPNDDVSEVDPLGPANVVHAGPLTTATRRTATVSGRVDRFEDPRDVYRVWIPRASTVTVAATSPTDVDVTVLRAGLPSVAGTSLAGYRLGRAANRGPIERLGVRNAGKGRWAYLVVAPGRSTIGADYRVVLSSRAS